MNREQWKDRCNDFRKNYDSLPYTEQRKLYDDIASDYPNQNRFDFHKIKDAVLVSRKVLEVGGWKGHLAKAILEENNNIQEWRNIEISQKAVDNSVCDDPRFKAEVLDDFVWNKTDSLQDYDALILSHVVEHWKADEFKKLITNLSNIKTIFMDIPIPENKPMWDNYVGTHVIEIGWKDIDLFMKRCGFATIDKGTAREYVSFRNC